MPRESGASSIPEASQSNIGVSGILGRPVKPDDDIGRVSACAVGQIICRSPAPLWLPPSLRGALDKIAKQFCAEATKQSRIFSSDKLDCFALARNDAGSCVECSNRPMRKNAIVCVIAL